MLRPLFSLIGYLSTATIIAVSLGLGYLVYTGSLNDEKAFQIVAAVHGVDLNQITEDHEAETNAVPPEEMSLDERDRDQQVMERNYEVKKLALDRGRQEFQYLLGSLEARTARIERQALEIQNLLDERRELSTQESIDNVVTNLQDMPPETAKLDLLRMMEEDREEDVIILWVELSPKTRKRILSAIESQQERDYLHEMHRLMLAGYPHLKDLQKADAALQDLDSAVAE